MVESVEAQRFVATLRMAEEGIALMRQNFRRLHPSESEEQIDRRLAAWLADRPLDGPGPVPST
jgi:hypothetical protein